MLIKITYYFHWLHIQNFEKKGGLLIVRRKLEGIKFLLFKKYWHYILKFKIVRLIHQKVINF